MEPIENIKKLFSRNFVESPLLETFEAGMLHLPTGELVACDPLITSDMKPFTRRLKSGDYPMLIHKERESSCVAYIELVCADTPVVDWELGLTQGQDPKELASGEIFGFPVESGMAAYMDSDTQNELSLLEQTLYERKGVDFMGLYEEFFHEEFFDENGAIDQFALLTPNKEKKGQVFAFEAGYGEGFYASYFGLDSSGEIVKVVSEFIEVGS
ncbi:DUF4241 domain-containing protein [Chryseobacterium sp. A321]